MADLGPEDSPRWNHPSNRTNVEPIQACHVCKNTIILWHCEDIGCPWCVRCSLKLKEK